MQNVLEMNGGTWLNSTVNVFNATEKLLWKIIKMVNFMLCILNLDKKLKIKKLPTNINKKTIHNYTNMF